MEANNVDRRNALGGVHLAEEAVLFESIMEGIGLTVSQNSNSRVTDGPHPISTETITLYSSAETNINPTLLMDEALDNTSREDG